MFGYLARPAGPGPFPAVVLLHWCSGFGPHDVAAAARLKSWGYVALALDSLGNSNRREQGGGAYPEAADAYAALHYLSGLGFVLPHRIAIMGYSMGAIAALDAVEAGSLKSADHERFRAAVAYYPNCTGSSGVMTVPTLILIGERDDWTPSAACKKWPPEKATSASRAGKGRVRPLIS
ncbi:MAG TPA: dienelactone hydrolase family protein [Rhodopila sp.]|nr:dienelactone hydrolase family protein [Rhodopila sp.]